MKNQFLKIVVLCLLLVSQNIYAQTGTIKGTVTDKEYGQELFGANISINDSIGCFTDFDGNYIIKNVPAGKVQFKVRYIGYEDFVDSLLIVVDSVQILNVEMAPGREIFDDCRENVFFGSQPRGQRRAINMQLNSEKFIEVNAYNKTQFLPDKNTAEALSRMNAITDLRENGEAKKIMIRGIEPKYTSVMIDEIPVPATDEFDRSVDLSLYPADMFDYMEADKSLSPDMDANAIGGTINLLTKPDYDGSYGNEIKLKTDISYNNLNSSVKDYKLFGRFKNDFFNNDLHLKFVFSAQKRQIPYQSFSGDYSNLVNYDLDNVIDSSIIFTNGMGLADNLTESNIYNYILRLNHFSKSWRVEFENIFSYRNDEIIGRYNDYNFVNSGYPANMQVHNSLPTHYLNIFRLKNTFRLNKTDLDFDVSYAKQIKKSSLNSFEMVQYSPWAGLPYNVRWNASPAYLLQKYESMIDTNGHSVPYIQPDNTYLNRLIDSENSLTDNNLIIKSDLFIPIRMFKKFYFDLSFGYRFNMIDRKNNVTNRFYDLGDVTGQSRREQFSHYANEIYGYNIATDNLEGLPVNNFSDPEYFQYSIIKSKYTLPWSVDQNKFNRIFDIIKRNDPGNLTEDIMESNWRDYESQEYNSSAYTQVEGSLKDRYCDNIFSFLIGIRYENYSDVFSGYNIYQLSNVKKKEKNIKFDDFFPTIILNYSYSIYSTIKASYFRSYSKPDYLYLQPFSYKTSQASYIHNPDIKPILADNYDIGINVYSYEVGIFTFNYFYKEIRNSVFNTGQFYSNSMFIGVPEELEENIHSIVPFDTNNVYLVNLPMNNSYKSYNRGVELSWQTNLWYLPFPLNAITLDINYSYITSNTIVPKLEQAPPPPNARLRFPVFEYKAKNVSNFNHPVSIFNVTLGYDYKSLSTAIGYQFIGETLIYADNDNELRNVYRKPFLLLDFKMKCWIYDLPLKASLGIKNILNQTIDSQINPYQSYSALPVSSEYFGYSVLLGLEYEFY